MAHAANKKVVLDQKILDDLPTMLNECNALVKRFRYAGEQLNDPKLPGFAVDYILALTTAKNKDRREWNRNGPAESAEEIGVLVNDLEDRDEIRGKYAVVFPYISMGMDDLTLLTPDHELRGPLMYPLRYPWGERSWRRGIKINGAPMNARSDDEESNNETRGDAAANRRVRTFVSLREYTTYELQIRAPIPYHWLGGPLSQLYAIDSWLRIEDMSLEFLRKNQAKIRGATVAQLHDAVLGDHAASTVGTRGLLAGITRRQRPLYARAVPRLYGDSARVRTARLVHHVHGEPEVARDRAKHATGWVSGGPCRHCRPGIPRETGDHAKRYTRWCVRSASSVRIRDRVSETRFATRTHFSDVARRPEEATSRSA